MKAQTATIYFSFGFITWAVISTLCWSTIPCATKFLTSALCAGAALALICSLNQVHTKFRTDVIPMLIICLGVFEAVYGMCQLTGIVNSGHYRYSATGTFANPGPYGGFLAICVSMALYLFKKRHSNLLLYAALLMSAMVIISMSRAAMVTILFTSCILWRKYVKENWKWILPLFLIATAILYITKAGSANGRIFMAIMGCSAWAHAPWIGHGSGSFLHALSCAEASWFATHPDSTIANWAGVAEYPFCEPLKIAVEYGAVGLLLFFGMVVSALISLWKNNKAEFFGLLSLCFFSLFSYPLSLWPFLLAMSVFIMRAIVPEKGFSTIKSITCGIIGISIVTISASLLKPYYKAKSDYLYLSYNFHPSLIKEYYHMVPFMLENPKFLFSFGKILREQGRYNDSNEMLQRCAHVSNDPMVYVLIGRNYEDMDSPDLAIQHYLDAFHMQPNRLYPLYRLMKLYQAEGYQSECLEYARAVSEFNPKLLSPAVTEMQSEANEIISQHEHQ